MKTSSDRNQSVVPFLAIRELKCEPPPITLLGLGFDFPFDVFPSWGYVSRSARIGPTSSFCYLFLYDEGIDVVDSMLSKAFSGEEAKIKLKSSSASGFLRMV
ncbi:hypothetical protein V6N13_044821 [Hibiscus sabdariffa]|uniref:Uncharacterized protein n=1 Tax=Hibiscus sabdariffa TaxID=183260 RepID=A0ABR2RJA8_9ROSI